MSQNRVNWISGAKFVAIMAVVIVHCNGLMYNSPYIASSTSFSVTLFILLSGIGTYLSYSRNPHRPLSESLIKNLPLIKSYLLATVILYLRYKRQFVVTDLFKHFLLFNVEPTFYFVFFFLQLKLISPFLLKIYGFCESKKNKNLLHILCLAVTLILSSVFINYTHTLDLYGGGKHLLGGSYFFIYYLGIVIGPISKVKLNKKQLWLTFCISSVLWFVWSLALAANKLPFDRLLRPFLGGGDNPPSMNYTVFALFTLLVCMSLFQILSGLNNKIIEICMKVITYLGNNTLEIFLYHFAIMKLATEFFPVLTTNVWLLRLILFPAMVFLAPVVKTVLHALLKGEKTRQKVRIK